MAAKSRMDSRAGLSNGIASDARHHAFEALREHEVEIERDKSGVAPGRMGSWHTSIRTGARV